jgi:hypothetical protein
MRMGIRMKDADKQFGSRVAMASGIAFPLIGEFPQSPLCSLERRRHQFKWTRNRKPLWDKKLRAADLVQKLEHEMRRATRSPRRVAVTPHYKQARFFLETDQKN